MLTRATMPDLRAVVRPGVWAIRSIDAASHLFEFRSEFDDEAPPRRSPPLYLTRDGVATIELAGVIVKAWRPWFADWGLASSGRTRQAFAAATEDPGVKGIVLQIDSPGGLAYGTGDLADAIYSARAVKPVIARIEDLGASAAYWAASQADLVMINPTATVGSIGTYLAVHDYSKMYDEAGVKVHVVRAGEKKGAGVPGTPITDEQLAEWQRNVDAINDHFIRGVARGRGKSVEQIREVADGGVHIGQAAIAAGLADQIGTYGDAVAMVARLASTRTPTRRRG